MRFRRRSQFPRRPCSRARASPASAWTCRRFASEERRSPTANIRRFWPAAGPRRLPGGVIPIFAIPGSRSSASRGRTRRPTAPGSPRSTRAGGVSPRKRSGSARSPAERGTPARPGANRFLPGKSLRGLSRVHGASGVGPPMHSAFWTPEPSSTNGAWTGGAPRPPHRPAHRCRSRDGRAAAVRGDTASAGRRPRRAAVSRPVFTIRTTVSESFGRNTRPLKREISEMAPFVRRLPDKWQTRLPADATCAATSNRTCESITTRTRRERRRS